MRWEHLTSPDFEKAVATCAGVGIIPIGVLEPHGAHMPLGTDMLEAHWTACRAAEQEAAIVFPQYPMGLNHEGAHLPGALVIKRDILFIVLENICDEMGRNGLSKIILLSGHGGNRNFLPMFVQTLTEKKRNYAVYNADVKLFDVGQAGLETDEIGHACEAETSRSLHINPELIKMEQLPDQPFTNMNRNQPLKSQGGYTSVDWYAMYPNMYVGDAHKAADKKGKILADNRIKALVDLIRLIKEDTMTGSLLDTFMQQREEPRSPYT